MEHSIFFKWTILNSGSNSPTEVEIVIKSQNGNLVRMQRVPVNVTGSMVSLLEQLTTYNFTFYVISAVGKSHPVKIQATTLSIRMLNT